MTTPTVDPENAASSASSTCSPNFELEPRANSTTDPVRSGAGGVSSILRETIETKLAELRADCALKRQIKRNAFFGALNLVAIIMLPERVATPVMWAANGAMFGQSILVWICAEVFKWKRRNLHESPNNRL